VPAWVVESFDRCIVSQVCDRTVSDATLHGTLAMI